MGLGMEQIKIVPHRINAVLSTAEFQYECKTHGKYIERCILGADNKVIASTGCPECNRIRQDEERKLNAELETKSRAEAEQARLAQLLKKSAIPGDYAHKSFDNFVCETDSQSKALRLSKSFVTKWPSASERGYGLLFFGNCGTGKSHLACAVLKALMTKTTVLYARVPDIIRFVRSSWRRDSQFDEEQAISTYAGVGLLAIDEVGVQAGSDNEKNILFSIIDERLSHNRPTIFITNLVPAELSNYLGERTVDRIKAKCVPFQFSGPSHRRPLTLKTFGELE